MSAIDPYIDELRRSGDTTMILLSEAEPRMRGKGGERTLETKVSHKDVTALVEEIVPPECFADLVMMEPVEFPFSHQAGELSIRVVPGPSIWRVVMDVKGDGLAPLPAKGDEEDEGAGSWKGLESNPSKITEDRLTDSLDGGSFTDLERIDGSADTPVPEFDSAPASQDGPIALTDDEVPLSEALLADDGEEDEDIDLGVLVSSEVEPEAAPDDPADDPVELDDAPLSVAAAPDRPDAVAPAEEVELGRADSTPEPETSPTPSTTPAASVTPLEIDLGEGDVMQHEIEGVDTLLEAAWGQSATGVLLRDDQRPLMVRAGDVLELPFAQPTQRRLVHDLLDIVASPSQAEQLEIRGQCRFVYRTGGGVRVRCTIVQDGGVLAASIRRLGDEHLPEHSERWMPEAVHKLLPGSGLVIVCGGPGQGKTTAAAALTILACERHPQVVVVGDPLERRLPAEGAAVMQRHVPDDVPNCAQALADAHLQEATLLMVDVPRPAEEVDALLSLAAQGRLVIATWTAPNCVEAIQRLMDALPPELAPAERARRGRNLVGVVAVQLTAASSGDVLPLFEVLRTNPALLGAVAESRLDALRGTEIRQLTFESCRTILEDRGLL